MAFVSGSSADNRVDWAALRQRRALIMAPIVLLGIALPFLARECDWLWAGAGRVAQARLLARLAGDFVLIGAYPATLAVIRLGLTGTTTGQHRVLLSTFPQMTMVWQILVALDGFVLVAWPSAVALPAFPVDVVVSVFSVVLLPLIHHHLTWFVGFDAAEIARARSGIDETSVDLLRAPLDTLDYRVLQVVAQSGSDVTRVMVNDMGIGHRALTLRLEKLCALRYLDLVREMHGVQLVLTTQATDTLALPVSLFTWDTDDRELLRELASARLALEAGEAQKVVVACARCCERMLRGLLAHVEPPVLEINHKSVEKATLGELVGACRQYRVIGKFEDNVLSAVNERRKKIHALVDEKPIDDQDAFVLYTLTEIVARTLLDSRWSRSGARGEPAQDASAGGAAPAAAG